MKVNKVNKQPVAKKGLKKQRKCLTLKERVEIIKFKEKTDLGVRHVAEKFKVGKTQVADIIKKKDELMKIWRENGSTEMKRPILNMKDSTKIIDDVVFEWFVRARAKNIPISGVLIKQQALEVAKEIKMEDFKASNGWLEKFRNRHSISFKSVSGEAGDVDMTVVKNWKEKIGSYIKNYEIKDIYNADETGLFFKALPDKTMTLKGEKCTGGKKAKQRLTILCCANMVGDKEPLLVIGKSQKPRCFKGIKLEKLPVTYKANKKAWMTAEIMTEWLDQLDRKMKRQNRKILLFLDNAASHPEIIELDNITLVFFPANTTSICQPLDQGIIRALKVKYRLSVTKQIISLMETCESATELSKKITVLDAITWIADAWASVKESTITKCFEKAGFSVKNSLDGSFDSEDDVNLKELSKLLKESGFGKVSAENYAEIDTPLLIEDETIDLKEILNENRKKQEKDVDVEAEAEAEEENSSDEESSMEMPDTISSINDVLRALGDLRKFAEKTGDGEALRMLANIQMHFVDELIKKNVRQTTIREFFNRQENVQ